MTTTTTHTTAHLVSADQVRRAVTGAGSHFFDAEAMRFFASRTARTGWSWSVTDENDDLVVHFVLVTSEQFIGNPALGIHGGPRRYTVRHFVVTDFGRRCERLDDHGTFMQYATAAAAHRAAAGLVAELTEGVAR